MCTRGVGGDVQGVLEALVAGARKVAVGGGARLPELVGVDAKMSARKPFCHGPLQCQESKGLAESESSDS